MMFIIFSWLLYSSTATAHDFSEHWISVSLYKNTIRIKATPPIDQFLQFDADSNGWLCQQELLQFKAEIQKQFESQVSVLNEHATPATFQWKDVTFHPNTQHRHLSMHLVGKWEQDITNKISLRYAHLDSSNVGLFIRANQEVTHQTIPPEKKMSYLLLRK